MVFRLIISVGQSAGLSLRTNTAHPIRFTTNGNQSGVTENMSILGSGSRDVAINTPLTVKSASTTFGNFITVGSTMASSSTALTVVGASIFGGSITCSDIRSSSTAGVRLLKSDGTQGIQMYDNGNTEFNQTALFKIM